MTKQQRLVLVISILASFVGAVDGFIVNVALPTISRDLGGGLLTQQWVVDAYLITLGACILIAGSLSDMFGRKRILSIGLLWFGIASIGCALAPTATILIVARGLQGIAGALLVPSSLAMIISSFSGPAQGKAIGTWTAWFSMAAVVGPILGGVIIAVTSWRWIFAINVLPITINIWLLRKLEVPERIKSDTKVDVIGAVLCIFALAGPVFALIEQPHYGWGEPIVMLPLVIGLMITGFFIYYESRRRDPMLPLSLFKVRNFSVGNVATAAIYGGLSMMTFVLVIFLQQVAGYSALQASVVTLPVTFVMFFLSSRAGALAGKFGPRLFMTVGPLLIGVGFLLIMSTQKQVSYVTQLLPGVLLFALGLATTVAPLTSTVLSDIDKRHAGVASAVNNAISRIAGLITVAIVGVIIGKQLNVLSFHRVLMYAACLVIVGGIVSGFGIRNHVKITAT